MLWVTTTLNKQIFTTLRARASAALTSPQSRREYPWWRAPTRVCRIGRGRCGSPPASTSARPSPARGWRWGREFAPRASASRSRASRASASPGPSRRADAPGPRQGAPPPACTSRCPTRRRASDGAAGPAPPCKVQLKLNCCLKLYFIPELCRMWSCV